MQRLNTWLVILVFAGGMALPSSAAPLVTDQEVEQKINELKLYLYEQQDKELGGWFGHYDPHPDSPQAKKKGGEPPQNLGGPTAIATLALLISGESSQDPRMVKAINYLRTLDEMYGTYALSLKVHAWSYLPDRYRQNLERDANILLGGANPDWSFYGYKCYRPAKSWDNSTTQYGILGMWQFAKRGGQFDPGFWQNAAKHFLEQQNKTTGGWGYKTPPSTRLTMTCAGLTCLAVVQQELHRDRDKAEPDIAAAMEAGLKDLDKRFNPAEPSHGGGGYYRYGVERVALATGVKYLDDQDWFESIAAHILGKRTDAKGAPRRAPRPTVVNNSFDLMFLSRGRIPVWCNKIKVQDAAWNNRPNDIYFLSRHLSKINEHEINWQYLKLDRPVMDYLSAPVAWLSSDAGIDLSEAEVANLKTYLDLGGMLIANSEGSTGLEHTIEQFAARHYPDLKWTQYPVEHPFGSLIFQVEGGKLPMRVLDNGARPLIVMPDRDWGLPLQKEKNLGAVVPGQVMTNIYATVTDRGSLPNRLIHEFPVDSGNRDQHPAVWVAQAKFGPQNKLGNPEPASWTAVRNLLGTDAGLNVQWSQLPLSEVGGGTMQVQGAAQRIALLHIAGARLDQDHKLTDGEKAAIRDFVAGGGTVLVEGVGGRSEFAVNMASQLQDVFGAGASRLSSVDPVISGTAGVAGRSVGKVTYRRFSVIQGAKPRPRLGAISVGGRAAVIFSSEDLSQAALGIRHWGINGYEIDDARQILVNLLLAASKPAPAVQIPIPPAPATEIPAEAQVPAPETESPDPPQTDPAEDLDPTDAETGP